MESSPSVVFISFVGVGATLIRFVLSSDIIRGHWAYTSVCSYSIAVFNLT